MSGESFGVPPCTCAKGRVVNGHQTWIVNPDCTVPGKDE